MGQLVTIYRPQTELEARLVEDILRSEGVPCVLRSDEIPMYTGLTWGSGPWGAVMVSEADVDRAGEIIELTPGLGPDVKDSSGETVIHRLTGTRLHLNSIKPGLLLWLVILLVATALGNIQIILFMIVISSFSLIVREFKVALPESFAAILMLLAAPMYLLFCLARGLLNGIRSLIDFLQRLPEILKD